MTEEPRRLGERGFRAGALASLPMAAVMLVCGSLLGVPTLPDLFADPILFLVPGPLFGAMIDSLQFAGKTLLLAFLLEGQLLVCGLVGRFWARRHGSKDERGQWRSALILVGAIYVVVELALLPALGGGFFGGRLASGPLATSLALLAVHAAYAVGLVAAFRWLGREGRGADLARRRALATVGAASLAVVGGGTLWRALGGFPVAGSAVGGRRVGISEEVTPTELFYVVSKNFVDPSVDEAGWRLRVDGGVDRPTEMTLADLKALPSREQYFTLACISNTVGGDLIGNGHWRGVPLRDLLAAAGVRPGARKVVFHAADGYTDSITIEKALEERTLLAYEMNGQPLTRVHGFPLRLLVPDIYGMKNAKWITRIEVLDREFHGYWQDKGWDDRAQIQTLSRIDVPLGGRTVSAPLKIGGIAHAGVRGVKRVEISTDGGRSWAEAVMRPRLSPDCWTIWELDWAPAPGRYTIVVRATDGIDRVQVAERQESFPAGSTGRHSVRVAVV